MVIALTGFELLRGTWQQEILRERLRPIESDLKRCRTGVPCIY
jgi:hypothetical protein